MSKNLYTRVCLHIRQPICYFLYFFLIGKKLS
nr:MAG TPA: hypothetical protein [Caudoviricetes sp.]